MVAQSKSQSQANGFKLVSNKVHKTVTAYTMLAPFLIVFIAFVALPMFRSLYLSLTKYNGIKPPEFIGLLNYSTLFKDPRFLKAVSNMLGYVPMVVVLNTSFGLLLAMIFRGEGLAKRVARVLFFLPSVTSGVAVLLIWRWMFSGETYGLINTIRSWFGAESVSFLSEPAWAIPILILIAVWGGMGYSMVLFLAGLNSIPNDLYEAATIDGSTKWQNFFYITLPLLRPVTLYVVVTGLISAFQVFSEVYIVFRSVESIGGVLDSGLMIVPYLYDRGFNRFKLGYASAIAWVLFFIILVLSLINMRLGRGDEEV